MEGTYSVSVTVLSLALLSLVFIFSIVLGGRNECTGRSFTKSFHHLRFTVGVIASAEVE